MPVVPRQILSLRLVWIDDRGAVGERANERKVRELVLASTLHDAGVPERESTDRENTGAPHAATVRPPQEKTPGARPAARAGTAVQSAAVRGWSGLYAESVRLGVRHLFRHGYRREAVVRVVVPLDPSRYLELPWAVERLGAARGERILDLASPKLLAVTLARQGMHVTSVDQLEREVETWRALAGDVPGLELQVADGRALPFGDASFDHGYSISVLEHIEEPGDAKALSELARVVRPGGRVLVTLPHATVYREDWRDEALYANEPGSGRAFFQRWYDPARVDALVAAAPGLELVSREVVRMEPNWNDAYVRSFPWLVPLGPVYGLLGREVEAPDGDVVRLAFVKR